MISVRFKQIKLDWNWDILSLLQFLGKYFYPLYALLAASFNLVVFLYLTNVFILIYNMFILTKINDGFMLTKTCAYV